MVSFGGVEADRGQARNDASGDAAPNVERRVERAEPDIRARTIPARSTRIGVRTRATSARIDSHMSRSGLAQRKGGFERKRSLTARALRLSTRLVAIYAMPGAATLLVVAPVVVFLIRSHLTRALGHQLPATARSFPSGPSRGAASSSELAERTRKWLKMTTLPRSASHRANQRRGDVEPKRARPQRAAGIPPGRRCKA